MSAYDPSVAPAASLTGWERFSRAAASGFRRYAQWLVGISWKMFFLLSVLLLIGSGILSEIPPFSFKYTVSTDDTADVAKKRSARAKILKEKLGEFDVKIDDSGIHIKRKRSAAAAPPEAKGAPEAAGTPPSPPEDAAAPAVPAPPTPPAASRIEIGPGGVSVTLPPEAAKEIRAAVEEIRNEIRDAVDEEIASEAESPKKSVRTIRLGSFLPNLAMLLIVASMVIKIVYAGRVQAEVKAAAAQEAAGAESLKRQVVEARMAAMQAQIEPHFLFNTLASIDHLIEVDPTRASKMQKNLISLLRASMPTLREGGTTLGRELAVVRPYLEILRVRMEDRLQTQINVGEGLHSAEFPAMMLQSLVENAIKHGLEPKPEGGVLSVGAEIVHGKLAVTVADTGAGFGRAATAGTGVGLNNIRERLKLLYGSDAELRIAENTPAGTIVTIVVPYKSANGAQRA
jgi:hypothetical protein